MTVKFIPAGSREKSRKIEQFLTSHKVQHELVTPAEFRAQNHLYRAEFPAVEVDGRLFVDPNDGALRKILHVD